MRLLNGQKRVDGHNFSLVCFWRMEFFFNFLINKICYVFYCSFGFRLVWHPQYFFFLYYLEIRAAFSFLCVFVYIYYFVRWQCGMVLNWYFTKLNEREILQQIRYWNDQYCMNCNSINCFLVIDNFCIRISMLLQMDVSISLSLSFSIGIWMFLLIQLVFCYFFFILWKSCF